MSEILLDGHCSQEAEISQEDYYIFWLTNAGLEHLATLLEALQALSPIADVRIGTGRLRFQIVPDGFVAATIGDKAISIQASQYELSSLARRLHAMAEAKPDPDHLVHIHLDNLFTSKPIGLSDIVFQRIDEYFRPDPHCFSVERKIIIMKKSLETLLGQIDWASYEYAVFAALQDAVEKYNTAYAQDATEKVSQVSLWTDPKVAVTAINFDTAAYYLRYRDFTAERYRRQNHEQWANELEAQQFQGDTTVFKHCDFVTLDHPEFHAVQEAGLWTHAQEAALLERINRSLLAVVEHAKQEGLFSRLHREPVIEVGVNSPRDWYDYTQIV